MKEIKINLPTEHENFIELESGMILDTNLGIKLILSTKGLSTKEKAALNAEFLVVTLTGDLRATGTIKNSKDHYYNIKKVVGKLTI